MFIKLTGVLLVIAGCGIYGMLLCHGINRRIEELNEYKAAIILLEGQISYGNYNLPQAFSNISDSCSILEIKNFYKYVSDKLYENSGRDFCEIWCEGMKKYSESLYLKDKDKLLLTAIGSIPLYLEGSTQINYLEEIKIKLESEISRAKNEAASKCKIYRCMGFSAGAFLVLLLI